MRIWVHGLVVICMALNSLTPVVSAWLLSNEGSASVFMQGEQPPTPTETPTPLPQEETETPTETALPTATVQPMETPQPTETMRPNEIQDQPETWIVFNTHPAVVSQGGKISLEWSFTEEFAPGIELLITLPVELRPEELEGLVYDENLRQLTFPASDGEVRLQTEAAPAEKEVVIHAALRINGEVRREVQYAISVVPSYFVSEDGGQVSALDGAVVLDIPRGALAEDTVFSVNRVVGDSLPAEQHSATAFEVLATGTESEESVTHFEVPIRIEVAYDEASLPGDEHGLLLTYFDEELQDWQILPSYVDAERNVLIGRSDHLTVFNFDYQTWQGARLPSLDAAQVSGFTGAANYAYPISVPAGPGGLQPSLTLSYNSQVVDAGSLLSQSGWVGMGWSLDTGYIERDMHGTDDDMDDDTFQIVTNGISDRLLLGADGYYHTTNESFWRLQLVNPETPTTSYWRVWDKSGMQYFFEHRAMYPRYTYGGGICNYDGQRVWRWSLTRVQNIYGKELSYTYETESKGYRCENLTPRTVDMAVYPQYIRYPYEVGKPRYLIAFERVGGRGDYASAWSGERARVFYQQAYLNAILVISDLNGNGIYEAGTDVLIRKYNLRYAGISEAHIYPGYTWSGGGKTLTLLGVQEYGLGASSSLPETTFGYDGKHLQTIQNGYGGEIGFTYEVWHDVTNRQDMQDTCNLNKNQPQEDCGWSGIGWEDGEVDGFFNVSTTRQLKDASLQMANGHFVYPGGQYWVQAAASANVQIGMRYQVNGQWVDYLGPKSGYVLTLPTDINSYPLELASCSSGNCVLDWFTLIPLPTRYRVTQKTLHDAVADETIVTAYRYDGGAMNDIEHSANAGQPESSLYAGKPYTGFRGHAMVEEIAPGGRITTTFYRQDDNLSGYPVQQIVHTQHEVESFENTDLGSYAQWTFSGPGTRTVERQQGDNALKINNPYSTDAWVQWNGEALKEDGEAVLFQFRTTELSGLVFSAGVGSGSSSWYARISGGAIQSVANGTVQSNLLTAQPNTWYVVLIIVDKNNGNYLSIWERDNPSVVASARHSFGSGLSWKFQAAARGPAIWLDAWSTGTAYSWNRDTYLFGEEQNVWQPPALNLGSLSGYTDLRVIWPRVTAHYNCNFGSYEERGVNSTEQKGSSLFLVTREEYFYSKTGQQGNQYGNRTRTVQSEWDGSIYIPYRATLVGYYPNDNPGEGKYLVGLPASQNTYKCNGNCDFERADMLSSQWYLYDSAETYNVAPTIGVLTGKRTLLHFGQTNGEPDYNVAWFADEKYQHDSWGNVTQSQAYRDEKDSASFSDPDTNFSKITTTYDPQYNTYPITVANSLNQSTTMTYDYNLGVVLTVTDANQVVTSGEYDSFGRLVKIVRPGDSSLSPTARITYHDPLPGCEGNNCAFWTLAEQRIEGTSYAGMRKIYDGMGRLLQSQVVGAQVNGQTKDLVVNYAYDVLNNSSSQTVPFELPLWNGTGMPLRTPGETPTIASQSYVDIVGRPTFSLAAGQSPVSFTYEIEGDEYVTKQTQDGRVSSSRSDLWGRVVRNTPPIGSWITYQYNEADQLVGAKVEDGVHSLETEISYDLAGRKLTLDDPDMGKWSYTYDAIGNLTSQTDARSCTTTLIYDLLNRVTNKTYGTGCPTTSAVAYSYDAGTYGLGQRTGMTDGSGSTAWTYDARGRVLTETRNISGSGSFKTQWTYNSADQVKTIRYPGDNANGQGETVTYTYLPQMALNTVVGTNSYVSSSKYDAIGRLTERNLGSSLRQSYSYVDWDEAGGGRLDTLKAGLSPNYNNRLNLNYDYDAMGNITQIVDTLRGGTQTQTFQYDALDRLTSAVAVGGTQGVYPLESYSYDGIGNLASKAGVVYGYHAHAVTHVNGVEKYWYDDNGSQTKRIIGNDTYDLAYDAENRLLEVKKNGVVWASFVYNGNTLQNRAQVTSA